MWLRHWGFTRDPFVEIGSPYVALPSHDEAVARLVYAIETGQSHVAVWAASGMGKTTVLRQACSRLRSPRRRIVVVSEPLDGAILLGRLAEGLGAPADREPSLGLAWRSLAHAVRARCLEGFQVVLAIDEVNSPGECAGNLAPWLNGLGRPGLGDGRGVTVVVLHRDGPDQSTADHDRWTPQARLKRLTRSEAEHYLSRKLAAVGCRSPIFTSRAITRLQSLCAGVPRGLERLATLSLLAAALRGIDVISPDVVDGITRESPSGWSVTTSGRG
jgi:MSHA biogenesis protein MshM